MEYKFGTRGTCAQAIMFELDDENNVHNTAFYGGCNGNLKGIGMLVEGMPAEQVIEKLKGTTCGMKATSCPDQLALALTAALEQQAANAQQG